MQTASPPSSDANTSEFDYAGRIEGPRAIQVLRLEGSRTRRTTVTRNEIVVEKRFNEAVSDRQEVSSAAKQCHELALIRQTNRAGALRTDQRADLGVHHAPC